MDDDDRSSLRKKRLQLQFKKFTTISSATFSSGLASSSNITSSTDNDTSNSSSSSGSRRIRKQSNSSSSSDADVDADAEISALSMKLIVAVERQADLEDRLASTRHELSLAHKRVIELEELEREHQQRLSQGLLVERKDVEIETSALMQKLMQESRERLRAEKDKRSIEQEVEDLTRQLFEEANKMVASARMEKEEADHRNRQLSAAVKEKDNVLASLQEELKELKAVLEQVTSSSSER